MSKKNIFSKYTKEKNKKAGRRGYGMWKREIITNISPKEYGIFVKKQ